MLPGLAVDRVTDPGAAVPTLAFDLWGLRRPYEVICVQPDIFGRHVMRATFTAAACAALLGLLTLSPAFAAPKAAEPPKGQYTSEGAAKDSCRSIPWCGSIRDPRFITPPAPRLTERPRRARTCARRRRPPPASGRPRPVLRRNRRRPDGCAPRERGPAHGPLNLPVAVSSGTPPFFMRGVIACKTPTDALRIRWA